MQANITHVLPLTVIRRTRLLPSPGKVLVREGQKVNANDAVAEYRTLGQHILIDIRRGLAVPSVAETEKLIERREGEKLKAGDVIAQTKGLLARVVRSPVDGDLVAIHNGRVLIEIPGEVVRLPAGFAGTIDEVIPERGVVLQTNGALIQGLWGNDRFDQGMLLLVAHSPEQELVASRLDVSMRGSIVMGGPCADPEALRMAEELPLRGLILSSLALDLVPQARALKIPVVVVEGFGKIPYTNPVFKILSTSEKRDVCLKASARNPYNGDRPEIILPLPAEAQEAPATLEFQPGQLVRVHGLSVPVLTGVIAQVRPGQTLLLSGVHAPAADVRLENNDLVTVPLANLDVLE
jgi:hypothetical protein